jgi:hypothetical protein
MRYAVLWDVDGGESVPCGLAVDGPEAVRLTLPAVYGFPEFIDEPVTVPLPSGAAALLRPGDSGYFDQVLLDLSHTFAIVEQQQPVAPAADL